MLRHAGGCDADATSSALLAPTRARAPRMRGSAGASPTIILATAARLQQAQHGAVHRAAAGVQRAVEVAADQEHLRVRGNQVAPQPRAHLAEPQR